MHKSGIGSLMADAGLRRAVTQLAAELRRIERRIEQKDRTTRTPQLGHSALGPGQAITLVDETNTARGRLGWINGALGYVIEGGDPPSAPTVPTVTPSIAGLRVSWDGQLADEGALPADFDRVAVHVSTTDEFVPSAATLVGSIRRAGEAGLLPVTPLPYEPHYVRLVGVTTGGVTGEASGQASGTPVRVDGPDLVANSVTAGHIQAGAVTADKLEAILALVTRIVGGDLSGARVEIDSGGLRGYNASDELIFSIDTATGSALFSGDIVGANITGSSMLVGNLAGTYLDINTYSSGGEEQVFIFMEAASGPTAYLHAQNNIAGLQFTTDGDEFNPAIAIETGPSVSVVSVSSPSGASTQMVAAPDFMRTTYSPPREDGYPWADASVYAYVRPAGADRWPAIGYTSPSQADHGYAQVELEGASASSNSSQVTHRADSHIFSRGVAAGSTPAVTDGVVALSAEMSVLAERHAPKTSDLITNPGFGTAGAFVDFTAAQWPSIPFRTPWSGRVRVKIMTAGINHHTANSSLAVGFRLSGGSVVPASLSRSAYIRSRGAGVNEPMPAYAEYTLELEGNTDCVLTPAWRLSSGGAANASFYQTLANTITVEPLM